MRFSVSSPIENWSASKCSITSFLLLSLVMLSSLGFSTAFAVVDNLKQVHIIYRHGDRAPTRRYRNDNYDAKDWPEGLGNLTKQGVEHQYRLGQYFAARYAHFLTPGNSSREVLIRASDYNRVLESAQANAAGMFPPASMSMWNSSANGTSLGQLWQPVPVHTVAQADEFLVKQTASCPKLKRLNRELYESPFLLARHHEYTLLRSSGMGLLINEQAKDAGDHFFDRVLNAFDSYECLRLHNVSTPKWINESVHAALRQISGEVFHSWSGTWGDGERARLIGGHLLYTIITRLQQKPAWPKIYIYAGHDSTISGLNAIMHMITQSKTAQNISAIPPFSASVSVELFQNDSVRVLYKEDWNSTDDPLVLSHFEFSNALCPLSKLVELAKDFMMEDWKEECADLYHQYLHGHSLKEPAGLWGIAVVIALLVVIIVAALWWRRQKQLRFKNGLRGSVGPVVDPPVAYRALESQSHY